MANYCPTIWFLVKVLGCYWIVLSSCYKPIGEEAWLQNQKLKEKPEGKI
jgi:hypothetical protein